jgi:hypothetical protein
VWADPDIGEALFYVVVESPDGGPPAMPPREVSMWAEPTSGRVARANYPAQRQSLRNQVQFEAKPYFDQRDMWNVGFRLVAPDGHVDELTTEIESTPPGYGPWDFLIYLFPFVLLAGLWAVAMFRRFRAKSHPVAEDIAAKPCQEFNVLHEVIVQRADGKPARPDPAWASKRRGE